MKKLLFICLVTLWVATQTKAQMRDTTLIMTTHKVDGNSLLQKSQKQKSAAWVMLGGGAGMALAGLLIMTKDAGQEVAGIFITVFTLGTVTPEQPKKRAAGPVLTIAGTGAMLGSIPLFSASAKNKTKANIILKNESLLLNPQLNTKDHFLTLGVKISL
ncbi:MAG: hypothetical protein ACR2KX_02900 [Chitinophagaceae bacterium]